MLAGWCNLNSYQLITRPEIRRVEDLRGKVIGIGRFGAAADWGLRLILRKLGINENKDVQIIQAGGGGPSTRLAAMEAKKLDATVLDSPQNHAGAPFRFSRFSRRRRTGHSVLAGRFSDAARAYVQAHGGYDPAARPRHRRSDSLRQDQSGSGAQDHAKYLRVQDREALEDAYESFVLKQFPRAPYAVPAAVQIIFDLSRRARPARENRRPAGIHRYAFRA